MAYSVPDPYRQAIRGSVAWWVTVAAEFDGSPVATGLRPVGGNVTDTTQPGVRRVLNVDLVPVQGQTANDLYETLGQFGTLLTVTTHVRLGSRTVVDIPMGVFDVDTEKLAEADGRVSLTAPDKWSRVQRARFVVPFASTPGLLVTEQIAVLIRGALGSGEPVTITATSLATVGAMTWEKDRDKAIIDLATGIGAWVFFDRDGVATIADVPAVAGSSDWLLDAGAVLVDLDRERSRGSTYNVVVVESSAAGGAEFPTQYVWDSDPASPTYAGTDPAAPDNVPGPFGVVTTYLDTPVETTAGDAYAAGWAMLARSLGLASRVSLGTTPNPAADAFDVLDVLPPHGWTTTVGAYIGGEGLGTLPFGEGAFGGGVRGRPVVTRTAAGAVLERHVADTITHPLVVGPPQTIDGRSTRLGGSS